MKKTYLYLALIAFASFSFASCDDNEDENAITDDSGIVGTWEGDFDEFHYPITTINADGTYEWEWAGIARRKDVGKYTYEDNKIVMNATKYYEWDDEKKGYVVTNDIENTPRRINILDLTPGLMRVKLNDYFMGGGQGSGFSFVLYRKGYVQDIKAKDLEGTWESYFEDDGTLSTRIVISGSNFTAYDVWTEDTTLCAEKYTGTWSIKNNELTVKPSAYYFSYDRPDGGDYVYSYVDPETLEAENWTKASWVGDEYTEKIYLSEDKKTLYAGGSVFKKK